MADILTDLPKIVEGSTTLDKAPIEIGLAAINNPDHPEYSADKGVSILLANGQSAIAAVADGMGSGGEKSAQAAGAVQKHLIELRSSVFYMPTVDLGTRFLKKAIDQATIDIKNLQITEANHRVDTTLSTCILCKSQDGRALVMLTANVGDSRVYKYEPNSDNLIQITTDHSLVQRLVDIGSITKEQAFNHPQRNVITRSVGKLNSPGDIDFKVSEANKGDLFLCVTDGVTDNMDHRGFAAVVREEYKKSINREGRPDLREFSSAVAERASKAMSTGSSHSKNDDIAVAVLGIPI